MSQFLSKDEYHYHLPAQQIAQQPLANRSDSKLLVYDGSIEHSTFKNIGTHLKGSPLIVFNNTKVIPARLFFKRQTGASIEVVLLNPENATMEEAMENVESVQWSAIIGGLKKWKDDEVITAEFEGGICSALLHNREDKIVELTWNTTQSFSEVITALGHMPLPPYIKRENNLEDSHRYQTVYAKQEGAVAAPTAGLHFDDEILTTLKKKDCSIANVTLHVGAGTFTPMTANNVLDHTMHPEYFEVNLATFHQLALAPSVVAVGTTSLRVLESLYWSAVKIQQGLDPHFIHQEDAYNLSGTVDYQQAIGILVEYLKTKNVEVFKATTQIMIRRGYQLKSIDALITNFHLPSSTLLVLVESAVGSKWKTIYQKALDQDYRFLSYGDSSLLYVIKS